MGGGSNPSSLADGFNEQFTQLRARVQFSCKALAQQHANALRRDAELVDLLKEDAVRLRSELVQLSEVVQPQFDRLLSSTGATNMIPRWPRQQRLSMTPTPSEQAAARRLQAVWRCRAPRSSRTGDELHCPKWLREQFVRPHARPRAPASAMSDSAPPAASATSQAIVPSSTLPDEISDAHGHAEDQEGAGDGEHSKHFMSLL